MGLSLRALIYGILHNIIFASPSKSRIRNLQSIGRGLRLKDDNSAATLYDLADDISYNGKENYTLQHFKERINIYNGEDFNYEIHNVELTMVEKQQNPIKIIKLINGDDIVCSLPLEQLGDKSPLLRLNRPLQVKYIPQFTAQGFKRLCSSNKVVSLYERCNFNYSKR